MHAVNTSKPSVARMYDHWLGGKDSYYVDREAASRVEELEPETPVIARQNRAFLQRVVRYLAAEEGIRQFLDVGTGLPTASNVHDVAQQVAPESRVVYVDNDDAVLAQARALLVSRPEGACAYVDADLRDTGKILTEAAATLDFSQPVAVLLLAILHFIPDEDDPWRIVSRLMEAVPSGSYLAVSHAMSADLTAGQMAGIGSVYAETNAGGVTQRSAEHIARFFGGLELVEPGLTQISAWRPDPHKEQQRTRRLFYGGVARKGVMQGTTAILRALIASSRVTPACAPAPCGSKTSAATPLRLPGAPDDDEPEEQE
jgi:hypothetical protein